LVLVGFLFYSDRRSLSEFGTGDAGMALSIADDLDVRDLSPSVEHAWNWTRPGP
jgi:hypothetical protein